MSCIKVQQMPGSTQHYIYIPKKVIEQSGWEKGSRLFWSFYSGELKMFAVDEEGNKL